MSDPTPLDIAARHQVLLERLKSGVVADIRRSLGSTGESVGLILGAVDAVSLRDMPRASLDALAADLGAAVSAGAAPIVDAVLATSGEVATDTAGYEARLVQSVAVGRNIVVPPAAQVAAAIEAAPLFSGALLDPFVRDWQANAADAVAREVYAGYARGDTLADLKRAIRGTRAARYQDGLVQGVTARQAEAIARTSIQHAASVGRMELYKANPGAIKRYRWLSTLDGRTSAICRSLSGRVFDVGGGPLPPAHINCLTGDTDVLSRCRISNVYKRAYEGTVIDIRTESGRTITITPNHPVLTRRGWKLAGEIDCLDELVCIRETSIIVDDEKTVWKAKFSDLFAAANIAVNPSLVAVRPSATEDFHGDGINGDVSVINIDGLGWDRLRISIADGLAQGDVIARPCVRFPSMVLAAFALSLMTSNATASSIVGFFRESRDFLRRRCIHARELLLRPIALGVPGSRNRLLDNGGADAKFFGDPSDSPTGKEKALDLGVVYLQRVALCFGEDFEPAASDTPDNRIDADAKMARDILRGDSGQVEFDRVVGNAKRYFAGHVFNLENDDSWYLSNGIVTHNCRSQIIPEVAGADRIRKITQQASMDGPVSADLNYYDWLKTQPGAYQDDVIGPKRGALLRNGGLSSDEFAKLQLGRDFRPLTLDEMRAKMPAAFTRAGI